MPCDDGSSGILSAVGEHGEPIEITRHGRVAPWVIAPAASANYDQPQRGASYRRASAELPRRVDTRGSRSSIGQGAEVAGRFAIVPRCGSDPAGRVKNLVPPRFWG